MGFLSFYEQGELVDLEVDCRGTLFRVHKLILVHGSPFFRAMLLSDFAEKQASSYVFSNSELERILF